MAEPECSGRPGPQQTFEPRLAPRMSNEAQTTGRGRLFLQESEILGSDTRPVLEAMWVAEIQGILPSGLSAAPARFYFSSASLLKLLLQ